MAKVICRLAISLCRKLRNGPSRGEIGTTHSPYSLLSPLRWAKRCHLPISPLEGEMSGRTEGGATATSLKWKEHLRLLLFDPRCTNLSLQPE
ncbi:hypothetical protein CFBP5473_10040 [Agrobacterium larrymoorei]|uniref:Propionyl-coenzyme A carboxylase alpha polypeptide n=1 Tax=Agrobacterium larrymoorei TaxID=160699 RepID=A0A4D7DR90_9HYPH|nr:hypothetical protein CFBP5473_10040 [Agrobacterium larrymoorei]